MLKHKYRAAIAATGLSAMIFSMQTFAYEKPVLVDEFEKDGVQVSVWAAGGCEIPEIPGIEFPGQPDGGIPTPPETNVPDQPESEAPDNGENDAPAIPDQGEDNGEQSFAMQVIDLVNQERAKEGLAALAYDVEIEQAALVRAKETEISFSHTRPDGRTFSTALTEAGEVFRGAGENIAYGQKTPEQVMEGWMNSPGHRANIMNPNYTKIGVGYYQSGSGVNYWTQLFTY